jgi:AcrR family transcriptional regulator
MARPQAPRGQGRTRVMEAALELFAEHGVAGTSLQMIAEHLGVTKAAVYYQFHAKEDIVLAVVESAFADMRAFLDVAEAGTTPEERAHLAVRGLVDLVVDHRQAVAALYLDPAVRRIVSLDEQLRTLQERTAALLVGPEPDVRRRCTAAVLGAGVAHAGMDPLLSDVPDDVLREELQRLGTLLVPVLTGSGDLHPASG